MDNFDGHEIGQRAENEEKLTATEIRIAFVKIELTALILGTLLQKTAKACEEILNIISQESN